MAGALDVVVEFLADSSSIQKETAKIEGTGGKLKSWAKGIGAAIGVAFAVDQIKDWIGAASQLQDTLGATQQIFGSATGTVVDFSKKADKSFGLSQSAALDAADTFATFGKGAGLTGQNLAGFSTKLTGLAGDLASFRGTSVEQAVEAVGAALRGETEPIRAYGVLLDDATLRQQALAMGLIKTTKQALTPQQRVLAAQAQLFKQTGDAQGDFARTSDSAANQQKILAAEMENAKASLGTALLPVLKVVLPLVQAFAGFIKDNAAWLVPLTAAILAVTAAVWLWNAALAANPIVLIAIGIGLVIAALILLIKNWDTVWAAIKTGAAAVWGFLQMIWDKILGAINYVWQWIKTNWPLLTAVLTGPFGLALYFIIRNWSTIVGFFAGIIATIGRFFAGLYNSITQPFIAAYNAVVSWFGRLPGYLAGIVNAVVSFFVGLPGRIGAAVAGVFDAVIAPFQSAWNWIQSHIFGPLKSAWNGFAGIINAVTISTPGVSIAGHEIIPSFHWTPPWHVPELAEGGLLTKSGLVYAHAGEVVSPAPPAAAARSGPAVVIENAHFSTELDVELFMRRAAWTVRTARV